MRGSMKQYKPILSFILILALAGCSPPPARVVNLAHLDRLCEDVTIQGMPCTIVHIYSDAPDYGWSDAPGEGIACIDDVARAAIVYMRAAGTDDGRYRPRIRRLLNFVLALQVEDGTFYNFVNKDMTINRTGTTSHHSFGFWAARGYWALAAGYVFFKDRDEAFAAQLQRAWLRCLPQLNKLVEAYDDYQRLDGQSYPTWLLNLYAADATSEFLLGAAEYLAVERDPALQQPVAKLADGVVAMQAFSDSCLHGAFYSWPGYWHAWGNAQVQALPRLAAVLGHPHWLQQAELSGRSFLSKLLAGHWLNEYDFAARKAKAFPQIAYGVRTTALGFLQLYRASGDEHYAILAGLAASWLTGNNIAGQPLYDAATGRCYDGIDRGGINHNAGAESTIEALYTLIEIEKVPLAAAWLHARSQQPWGDANWPPLQEMRRTFSVKNKTIVLTWHAQSRDFTLEYP